MPRKKVHPEKESLDDSGTGQIKITSKLKSDLTIPLDDPHKKTEELTDGLIVANVFTDIAKAYMSKYVILANSIAVIDKALHRKLRKNKCYCKMVSRGYITEKEVPETTK